MYLFEDMVLNVFNFDPIEERNEVVKVEVSVCSCRAMSSISQVYYARQEVYHDDGSNQGSRMYQISAV